MGDALGRHSPLDIFSRTCFSSAFTLAVRMIPPIAFSGLF
jgi:hypothetical protein